MHCPYCDNKIDNQQEIRQIIREELMHLDPDVANSMLTQPTIRVQGSWPRCHEVKTWPLIKETEPTEVLRDEY